MYNGTPWGYIHKKKEVEQAHSEIRMLRENNQQLINIIKKLTNKKELSETDKIFLEDLGI